MTVRETNKSDERESHVRASGVKSSLAIPVMKATGRNTIMVVIVEARTARPTSPSLSGRVVGDSPSCGGGRCFPDDDGGRHEPSDAQGSPPR